jgi:predicted metalloenzyme YecM
MQSYLDTLTSANSLQAFLVGYVRDVQRVWQHHGLDIQDITQGDHIGFQVLSSRDFDTAHVLLSDYSRLTMDHVIHQRRNRGYCFDSPLITEYLNFRGIEIFEPKPNAIIEGLRPGVEHIAVLVEDYESSKSMIQSHGLEIAKEADYGAGRFFKIKPIGNVEVEYRDVPLIQ